MPVCSRASARLPGLLATIANAKPENRSAGLGWNITMVKTHWQKNTQLGEKVCETQFVSSLLSLKIKTVLHCMCLRAIFFWKLCLMLLGCPTWMCSVRRTYTVVCKFTKKASSCTECLETHSDNASRVTKAKVNHLQLHRIPLAQNHNHSWSYKLESNNPPSVQREFTQKSSSLVQDNARRELPSRFFMLTTLTDEINVGFLSFFINQHSQVSWLRSSLVCRSIQLFWIKLSILDWTSVIGRPELDRRQERNLLSQHSAALSRTRPTSPGVSS